MLKRLQPLGFKILSFLERWQRKFSISTNFYIGKVRVQPVYAIQESAGNCCKKLWRKAKCFYIQISTIFKNMDEQLKLAHRDFFWKFRKINMLDYVALQFGQASEFICACPIFCMKEEGRCIQTKQSLYVNYKVEELIYLLDVINFVYAKAFAIQSVYDSV